MICVELLEASVNGTLAKIELKWSPLASVCVVMASGGYPGNYAKGKIDRRPWTAAKIADTKVFHAGTALKDGQIVTNGGRVLGVTALGKDLRPPKPPPMPPWKKFILTARISAATSPRRRFESSFGASAKFRRQIFSARFRRPEFLSNTPYTCSNNSRWTGFAWR